MKAKLDYIKQKEKRGNDNMEGKCKRCAYKYGTLACCTTVSNKWVYSCKEGMARYKEKQKKKEKKYSVLVCIETSDAFYQEYESKEEADKIFNRFLTTLTSDEDETQEEIEELAVDNDYAEYCYMLDGEIVDKEEILRYYENEKVEVGG